jgi:uncharacterized DUF497 family protein
MRILWDEAKAETNLRKHGVSFAEAETSLRDSLSVTGYDPDHSVAADRFVTFGVSSKGPLLVVSRIEEGNVIRIISSRLAEKQEIQIYEEG